MTERIENCRIKSTSLGMEDHGIFTAFIHVEGDCWGCGFGGYSYGGWDKPSNDSIGPAMLHEFVRGVCRVVGVDGWEKLPGAYCRVRTDGPGGSIKAIGNLLKDSWFEVKK